jgi:alkanesulfonate monooxygenase
MSRIALHWYLPTHGDGRTLTQAGAATQSLYMGRGPGERVRAAAPSHKGLAPAGARPASIDYVQHVARTAEMAGFDGILTPTGTWCEDAWITCASLIPMTSRLRFLVAFRPGTISPTLAAQQAATFQRLSGGRLMLNIVSGSEDTEMRRFGDRLTKVERYERTDEFLTILRSAWSGPSDFSGKYLWAEGAFAPGLDLAPKIYFGGSSDAALHVASKHADVYLSWGELPQQIGDHFSRIRNMADDHERVIRCGVRLHVVARPTAAEAWSAANALLADATAEDIAAVRASLTTANAEGQRRMTSLVQAAGDQLEIAPNIWAGIGLLRNGAATALVGTFEDVADRIGDYRAVGADEFIFSGYPHVEEALWFSEGVMPILRDRGLIN